MEIKDIVLHSPLMLQFFIPGYFALFVLYDNIFLNYDILTRVVLSIFASIFLLIPARFTLGKYLLHKDNKIRQSVGIAHVVIIGMLFTLLELTNWDILLQKDPLNPFYIFPLFISIVLFDWAIKKSAEKQFSIS